MTDKKVKTDGKRPDGRYKKTFVHNKKMYYVYGRTKSELDKNYRQKRREVEEGIIDLENPTMKVYYELWSKNREGRKAESTLRVQEHYYNTLAKIQIKIGGKSKAFEDFRIKEIDADIIRYLQSELLEKGNSPQTVNDKLAFVSHMFHQAIKDHKYGITYNPCISVEKLQKEGSKEARDGIHRALTIEEQEAFFEQAKNSYYYNCYRFAILTGMRVGELGALYISDIHDGMIFISRTVTRTQSGSYIIGNKPKTKTSKRSIPLNDAINEVIADQKKRNIKDFGKKITDIHERLFKAREGGILLPFAIDRDMERICKKIEIERITFHGLRATFATRCIENGVAPRTLQELLGHADFALTMNLYGHVLNETKTNAMEKMNNILIPKRDGVSESVNKTNIAK